MKNINKRSKTFYVGRSLAALGLTALITLDAAWANPNNRIETAELLVLNTYRGGLHIAVPGENDYYRLDFPSPGSFTVQTEGSTDTFGYLLNATGAVLASNDDINAGVNNNFRITADVGPGRYYVRARSYAQSGTGWYYLRNTFTPRPAATLEAANAIAQKYQSLGENRSLFGLPSPAGFWMTPDGIGGYQHYANGGAIYYTRTTGAYEVHGEIRAKWANLGSERFGYPTTDETPVVSSYGDKGAFNEFKTIDGRPSTILWSPKTGAHCLYGAIRAGWLALNAEAKSLSYPAGTRLGFPITDEIDWAGERVSAFEGGYISWSLQRGIRVIYYSKRTLAFPNPSYDVAADEKTPPKKPEPPKKEEKPKEPASGGDCVQVKCPDLFQPGFNCWVCH